MLDKLLEMPREYAKVTGQKPDPDLYKKLMIEELIEVLEADSDEELLKEICDCLYVAVGYLNVLMGPENKTFLEVLEENTFLAKYIVLVYALWGDKPAVAEGLKRVHKNNLGRCYQDDGTIQRRDDGKIIKNPNYPKVDLSDLVKT